MVTAKTKKPVVNVTPAAKASAVDKKNAGGKTEGDLPSWQPILLLILLAVGAVWWASSGGRLSAVGTPGVGGANGTTTPMIGLGPLSQPGALALLHSFDQLAALSGSYEIKFGEVVDGVDTNITLTQEGKLRSAALASAFSRREYYWGPNTTIACEKASGSLHCASLGANNTSMLMQYSGAIATLFPNIDAVAQKRRNAELIQLGVIRFLAPPQSASVAGRDCTNLTYTWDYSNLTDSQLAQIGKKPTDAEVAVFRDYRFEKCIDTQTGIALSSHLKYNALGNPRESSYLMQNVWTPANHHIELPALDTDENALSGLFNQNNQLLQTMGKCNSQNGSERDQCVRTYAVSYKRIEFCELVHNDLTREQCALIVATLMSTPSKCPNAGSLRDECYIDIATGHKDASTCNLIPDAENKSVCVSAVANASAAANNTGNGGASAPTANTTNPSS